MNKSMILASLRDEREAEYLYGTLAATESGRIGTLFTALETESGRQGRLWENALKKLNESPPVFRPGLRAKIVTLLAGGFSMAAGEYVSVRTQREMLEHQIELEKMELQEMPEEEIEELTMIYMARGLEEDAARDLSRRLVEDPVQGLRTLAREELGPDPDSLASPTAAAVASFFAFAGGATYGLGRLFNVALT